MLESTAAVQVQIRMHLCMIPPAVLDSCCHQCLSTLESDYVQLDSGCSSSMDGMQYMASCFTDLQICTPSITHMQV